MFAEIITKCFASFVVFLLLFSAVINSFIVTDKQFIFSPQISCILSLALQSQ